MKAYIKLVIALFLTVLFNYTHADLEVPNNQRLVFQWNGEAVSWELCFEDEVFFQDLTDQPELSISQSYIKDGLYRYIITALSPQGFEFLYINKPASFISRCGGVKQDNEFYPMSIQAKVDIKSVSDVSQQIILKKQKFIALFIPDYAWSRKERSNNEILSIQPLTGNQKDWSWLFGDSSYRARSLKQQNDQGNNATSFIHTKVASPLVILGVAVGVLVLTCFISAPFYCLLGWKCRKRIQNVGN